MDDRDPNVVNPVYKNHYVGVAVLNVIQIEDETLVKSSIPVDARGASRQVDT